MHTMHKALWSAKHRYDGSQIELIERQNTQNFHADKSILDFNEYGTVLPQWHYYNSKFLQTRPLLP